MFLKGILYNFYYNHFSFLTVFFTILLLQSFFFHDMLDLDIVSPNKYFKCVSMPCCPNI